MAGQEGGGDSSDDADYAEAREQAQETQPGGYREKRAKSVRLISSYVPIFPLSLGDMLPILSGGLKG